MTIAAEFAKTRYTLGVPDLDAAGHFRIRWPTWPSPLQAGRNLARRAAWFLDNEPDERPELAPSAFVFMAEEAAKAATMAVHIQGGLGVSAEAAATRISGARQGLAAGRRRSRRQPPSGSPSSSPRAKARHSRAGLERGAHDGFLTRALADDDQAFLDEVRASRQHM